MSLTRDLVQELWSWTYEDLDEADVAAARRLLLDHVAVAAFGSTVEPGRLVREHVLGDVGGTGPALPVIGTPERAPAVAAAMANAVAAACFEFDDTHTAGSLHPGSVVHPAALAAAAVSGCDERTFVRAVVIGYEVMCRVGRAANPLAHRARHFHPTATTGHFGAAAAAAVCLGLDVATTVAALTLSGTAAGGNMQFVLEGGWTKQVHPAFAVQRGVLGAQLAARGFPGVADPLGGPRAFLASQSEDPRPERLLEGLGTARREVRHTGIKPYPTCRNTQGPLDALLAVRREHGVTADEVSSVTFGLIGNGVRTVFEPRDIRRRPRTFAEAQFSMPFVAAVALADGRVGLDQLRPERMADPALLPLMDAVTCVHDPELDARYPRAWPAWVEVTTTGGARLRAAVEHPHGDPDDPLDDGELVAKVADVCAGVYPPERQAAIVAAVERLPEDGSLAELVSLLGTGDGAAGA